MENKYAKYYKVAPTFHTVNVFNKDFFYRLFRISCFNCSLMSVCEPVKHKQNICTLANDVEKHLDKIITARVSSFFSDDFYIDSDQDKQILPQVLRILLKKYSKEKNAK